jgi:uncharacterized protein (DUF58 family)
VSGVLRTNRWRGVRAVALLAGGVGVLVGRPLVLLAAAIGVAYAAYATRATEPLVDLEIDREVSDDRPEPGDEVEVSLTVRNAGDGTLGDLRLVDGVPSALSVSDGSPRLGTALRPGAEVSLSYAVEARRGEHAFDPVQVLARDLSGAIEVERAEQVETTLRCVPTLIATTTLPLRQGTTPFTGRVQTDTGGSGVEFFATREYRHGDVLSRIDWKRRARTGELTTLEFREERAATVVLLIDARTSVYRAPRPGDPHAVDHAVAAAGEVFAALLDSGDQVGLTAIGRDSCWLAPGTSREHRARGADLLATHPTLAPVPPEGTQYVSLQVRRLRRRLPASAQVVLFSPLTDDYAALLARRLDAYGHATTVVSPDVTADGTPGQRLARVERELRLVRLREAGLRAIDWTPDRPLGVAIERASERWSR